ncbi:GlsB/YeaQ/YmgE family stress response membrane protein [Tepidiforma sp.]|uniref:GlsB/YeaQ/YmgE family stress response membrane protein n=1 Tax=Tepidiforma sp. TaxID=2682230 RepID=UPI002ADE1C9E|nr:GlsB/YeaQ/YmgE family stress response membrane protein [Tepidiforma sp.]
MGILAWLVFGLIAGAIAKLLMPGDDPGKGGFGGIVVTIAIGIVGAVIGGFIGTAIGWGSVNAFDIRSFGLAILGGVIFLWLLRALRR